MHPSVHPPMHPIVKLAKDAVESYVKSGSAPDVVEGLPEELNGQSAGVFVCLKRHGELRGCIGTIEPLCRTVAEETVRNAICAATQDPRFYPVAVDELQELEYSVDILYPPERVNDVIELDPKKYGVIVSKGGVRGLLLPDLDGVDTAEAQLRIAMSKAGLGPHEKDVVVERFEVKRFK